MKAIAIEVHEHFTLTLLACVVLCLECLLIGFILVPKRRDIHFSPKFMR